LPHIFLNFVFTVIYITCIDSRIDTAVFAVHPGVLETISSISKLAELETEDQRWTRASREDPGVLADSTSPSSCMYYLEFLT